MSVSWKEKISLKCFTSRIIGCNQKVCFLNKNKIREKLAWNSKITEMEDINISSQWNFSLIISQDIKHISWNIDTTSQWNMSISKRLLKYIRIHDEFLICQSTTNNRCKKDYSISRILNIIRNSKTLTYIVTHFSMKVLKWKIHKDIW